MKRTRIRPSIPPSEQRYAKSAPRFRAARPNYLAREWIYILAAAHQKADRRETDSNIVFRSYKYYYIQKMKLGIRAESERCSAVNQSGPLCECCAALGRRAELTCVCFGADRKIYNAYLFGRREEQLSWKIGRRNGIERNVKLLNKSFWVIADCQLESSSNWIHLIAKSRL